ncbi:MAG TPA: heme-copper oxidase subunit III [Acidimicrobiales bacterium]|nr:heme-copper oxidase subunit III [Acidimicrobiales bacterium]
MTQALSLEQTAPGQRHVPERPPLLAVGVMIWLGSELMFFSGLFAAYFTIRANSHVPWPPLDGKHLDYVQAGIFSVILLVSSPTFQFGVWAEERGERRKARRWIVTSFILGAGFLANTLYEWHDFASSHHGPSLNAYWSLFFIMTGIHGLHVALGLVAMIFLLGRMKGQEGDPGETNVYQAVGYYWHFVDFMWIGIFSCLFLFKSG